MLIIDAPIFIQGIDAEGYTTPKIVEEMKDPEPELLVESLIISSMPSLYLPKLSPSMED